MRGSILGGVFSTPQLLANKQVGLVAWGQGVFPSLTFKVSPKWATS